MSLPFELHQLEAFVVVSELLSIQQAADRLHIAQPAVTKKIRKLEHALGVQLLVRGHNRLCLTPAGRGFKTDAAYILKEVQIAVAAVRNSTIEQR